MTIDDNVKLYKALGHFDGVVEARDEWKSANWHEDDDSMMFGEAVYQLYEIKGEI